MPAEFIVDLVAPGSALLLIDQWSKRAVQAGVADRRISCGPILQIRRVAHVKQMYNSPAARIALVLVWFAALTAAILLYRSGAWFQGSLTQFGLGIALGGAAGNLWDVLRRRYVLDFLDLRWWPVFNLADVAIVAGLIVAFWPRA
jgi:signal peptidase II